jgi:signal recognition particle receptor subunit beta
MVLFNYTTKEMTAKIVYYGPGLCGKTTNLQYIHRNLPKTRRGDLVTLPTETDRTLFFDLLPLRLGKIGVFTTRLQLYTVPGQVFYNSTRKMVLRGVDGIVFVADSQVPMRDANIESLENLQENLAEHKLSLRNIPWVLQYNKRDLPNILPVSVLNEDLNKAGVPWFESVATTGVGVISTLKAISKMTLQHLRAKAGYVGIRDRGETPPDQVAIVREDEDELDRSGARKVQGIGFTPKKEAAPAGVATAPAPAPAAEEKVVRTTPSEVTVTAAPGEAEDGALVLVRKVVVPIKIRRSKALNGVRLDLRIQVECILTESEESEDEGQPEGYSWSKST